MSAFRGLRSKFCDYRSDEFRKFCPLFARIDYLATAFVFQKSFVKFYVVFARVQYGKVVFGQVEDFFGFSESIIVFEFAGKAKCRRRKHHRTFRFVRKQFDIVDEVCAQRREASFVDIENFYVGF
mgnify:CR=1 FL=1